MTTHLEEHLRFIDRRQFNTGILLTMIVSGCSDPGADFLPIPRPKTGTYRLGLGDEVRIFVFGEERLNADYKLSDTGMIVFPLLGNVPAIDKTTAEVEKAIAATLKSQGMLSDAKVTVQVRTYRPFYITGQIAKPGEYAYQPGITVLAASAVAGGFTPRAIDQYVAIQRLVGDKSVVGRADQAEPVLPGDIITVFERRF